MSKTKIEIRPLSDSKNDYNYNVDFEIEEKVSMCFYDDDTGEHRTITFKKEDFEKIQKLIEASEWPRGCIIQLVFTWQVFLSYSEVSIKNIKKTSRN